MGTLGHVEHLLSQSQMYMLYQGPAVGQKVVFKWRIMLAEEDMALLQDPGLCAGEGSFLFQVSLTTTGYPGSGWNSYSEVAYVASKIQRFLPVFFLVGEAMYSNLPLTLEALSKIIRHLETLLLWRSLKFPTVYLIHSGRNVSY